MKENERQRGGFRVYQEVPCLMAGRPSPRRVGVRARSRARHGGQGGLERGASASGAGWDAGSSGAGWGGACLREAVPIVVWGVRDGARTIFSAVEMSWVHAVKSEVSARTASQCASVGHTAGYAAAAAAAASAAAAVTAASASLPSPPAPVASAAASAAKASCPPPAAKAHRHRLAQHISASHVMFHAVGRTEVVRDVRWTVVWLAWIPNDRRAQALKTIRTGIGRNTSTSDGEDADHIRGGAPPPPFSLAAYSMCAVLCVSREARADASVCAVVVHPPTSDLRTGEDVGKLKSRTCWEKGIQIVVRLSTN
jgi:hypothetical protein